MAQFLEADLQLSQPDKNSCFAISGHTDDDISRTKRDPDMQSFDTTLFLAMTGTVHSPDWIVALASFLASAVVPLVAAAIVVAWVRPQAGWRFALLDAVAAGTLGLGLVQVIGALHYRRRPFEAGLGSNLLNHLPENSFPSDHATLMFALALGLLLAEPLRRAGFVVLALALSVGWARVFLGAHYPSDILGGAALAVLCVGLVKSLSWRKAIWSALNRVYETLLTRLHLPQALFPHGR